MIRPDMATMLSFIGTDVAVSPALLQQCLEHAVERSFNRITVDGETSTNDACVLVATGKAGNPNIDSDTHPHFALLQQAIDEVCVWLAQAIVRDGEGATRFVTVTVDEARTRDEACAVAYTIAHSPLVKTAIFGQDPNWGRILAAVGRAGVDDLQIDDVKIHLGDVCIVRDGGRDPDYTEEMGLRVMAESEISIRVALGRGNVTDTVWTSDLSYDYVKINADYRT
jgi:glutamate N-acetyltransferase/amino-acid N-acetyltransferase